MERMTSFLLNLVEAAVKAPSGDNLQPWRIEVDHTAQRIAIYLDETRDTTPMNAGQRMSRMAVGAAVENLLRAAESVGIQAELALSSGGEGPIVTVVVPGQPGDNAEIDPVITDRATNRRAYDGQALAAADQRALAQGTTPIPWIRTHWIFERERIETLAELIGQSDALMFSVPEIRKAFLDNVRFDAPVHAVVEEGLSIGSLELATADRIAVRLMPRFPDWLLRLAGTEGKFAATAKRLIRSSSGLCILDQADLDPESDLKVGRAMQMAWLAMTAQGLYAQPMMSIVVLDNMLRQNALPTGLSAAKVDGIVGQFHSLVPELADRIPGFLLRFGRAPAPSVRTGRRPLAANVMQRT
jgi:nitroreductase